MKSPKLQARGTLRSRMRISRSQLCITSIFCPSMRLLKTSTSQNNNVTGMLLIHSLTNGVPPPLTFPLFKPSLAFTTSSNTNSGSLLLLSYPLQRSARLAMSPSHICPCAWQDLLTPVGSVICEFIVANKLPQSSSRLVFASCAHALLRAEVPRLRPLKFPGRGLLKLRNGRLG